MENKWVKKPICGIFSLSMGWVRIFGYGIAWKNLRQHSLIFSERYGYVKTVRIGRFSFKWLDRPEEGGFGRSQQFP